VAVNCFFFSALDVLNAPFAAIENGDKNREAEIGQIQGCQIFLEPHTKTGKFITKMQMATIYTEWS
jgi:hypothetical protein